MEVLEDELTEEEIKLFSSTGDFHQFAKNIFNSRFTMRHDIITNNAHFICNNCVELSTAVYPSYDGDFCRNNIYLIKFLLL